MPDSVSAQEFGKLQAKVDQLDDMVREMRQDLKELTAAIENAKGGWKTVVIFGAIATTLGGLLAKILPLLAGVKG